MKEKCPECGNTTIGGYVYLELGKRAPYCSNCGLVLSRETINSHDGFLQFKKEQEALENPRLYNKGLGSRKQPKLESIRSHVAVNEIKGKDKTLKLLFDENELLLSLLKLNDNVGDECAYLTRKLVDKTNLKGTHLEFVSGSLIHLSARQMHIPLELTEINKFITYHGKRKLSVVNKFVERNLDLPEIMLSAEDYLPKFVSSLHLDYQYERESREVLKNMDLNGGLNKDKAAFSVLVSMVNSGSENAMDSVVNVCDVLQPNLVSLVRCVQEPLKSDIISACNLSKTDVDKIPFDKKIKCEVCGTKVKKITYLHLKLHGMTLDDYREKFPDAPLTSQQTRENNKNARLGTELSEITKQKLSEAHLGKSSGMKGKHHTLEAKQKQREANLGRCYKNSHEKPNAEI